MRFLGQGHSHGAEHLRKRMPFSVAVMRIVFCHGSHFLTFFKKIRTSFRLGGTKGRSGTLIGLSLNNQKSPPAGFQ